MSGAYYNEIDPYAAQWLRNLIAAGHIAPGDVDTRSILEVKPDDLKAYTQCHFFAGIGGWSYALRLAGVDDSRPVWTGSCPCQPFSTAGRQRGSADERHLWPAFFYLISECRPGRVFGEQVAGAAGLAWLDHVCADLEGAGYAAAAAALPACCVGAHHRRERLFWVAHDDQAGRGQQRVAQLLNGQRATQRHDADGRGAVYGLAYAELPERRPLDEYRQDGRDGQNHRRTEAHGEPGARSEVRGLLGNAGNAGNEGLEVERRFPGVSPSASGAGEGQATERAGAPDGRMEDASSQREGEICRVHGWRECTEPAGVLDAWSDIEWLQCSDGKARPTQPGLFPLAHGVSNRVGRLRAYGNAIVPAVGAAFIKAVM